MRAPMPQCSATRGRRRDPDRRGARPAARRSADDAARADPRGRGRGLLGLPPVDPAADHPDGDAGESPQPGVSARRARRCLRWALMRTGVSVQPYPSSSPTRCTRATKIVRRGPRCRPGGTHRPGPGRAGRRARGRPRAGRAAGRRARRGRRSSCPGCRAGAPRPPVRRGRRRRRRRRRARCTAAPGCRAPTRRGAAARR